MDNANGVAGVGCNWKEEKMKNKYSMCVHVSLDI